MLQLKLKTNLTIHIEVAEISPQRLQSISLVEIQKESIWVGNQTAELGDFFSVSGDPSDRHHVWTGDLSKVSAIGHQMQVGWIQIDGDVGNHLGSRMSGGTIHVSGDAASYLGCEMTGGLIHIKGNVGSHIGSAYDGGVAGQNGGAILIEGSAGNCVGESMRRGLIAVGGDVGNCCGLTMRAGTIVVHGRTGKNLATEMTRGTIILAAQDREIQMPNGFVPAGVHPMPVIGLLNRHIMELGHSKMISDRPCQLWHGDMLRGGRGELLIFGNG